MKTHPLCLKVPAQSPEEFARLCDSMKGGYDALDPIITLDGMILDGRHRYQAAAKMKVEPTFEEWKPTSPTDTPQQFVLRRTLHRTLTQGQRAALAAELLPAIEKQSTERMKAGKAPPRPDPTKKLSEGQASESTAIAARAAGTNSTYVKQAKAIQAKSPKTFAAMKAGDVSMTEAVKVLKAPERPKKETPAVAALAAAEAFKELVNRSHALRRDVEALTLRPEGIELAKAWKRIEAALDGVANDLRFKAPYKPCPIGRTCEVGCKQCGGKGWLSKDVYDALPEAIKQ